MALVAIALLLLLLVCQSHGIPRCAPQYPPNVNVLLDTWRLRTRDGWTVENTSPYHSNTWTFEGECEDSTMVVCTTDPGDKLLRSTFIPKTLPAPDLYPVNIFINITYSFGRCPRQDGNCDESFQTLISRASNFSRTPYTGQEICFVTDGSSGTRQFSYTLENTTIGLFLALGLGPRGRCVTVSRILVYNYECPGHDKLNTGLTRRPATQAPASGVVDVMSYCANNSHSTEHSRHDTLQCTSEGHWISELGHCVCDSGYQSVDDTCQAEEGSTLALVSKNKGVATTTVLLLPSTPTPTTGTPIPSTTKETEGYKDEPVLLSIVVGVTIPIVIVVLLIAVGITILAITKKEKKPDHAEGTKVATTNNIAYSVTVKPHMIHSQNPYGDIDSTCNIGDGSCEPDTVKNVAYEVTSFPTVSDSEVLPAYYSTV